MDATKILNWRQLWIRASLTASAVRRCVASWAQNDPTSRYPARVGHRVGAVLGPSGRIWAGDRHFPDRRTRRYNRLGRPGRTHCRDPPSPPVDNKGEPVCHHVARRRLWRRLLTGWSRARSTRCITNGSDPRTNTLPKIASNASISPTAAPSAVRVDSGRRVDTEASLTETCVSKLRRQPRPENTLRGDRRYAPSPPKPPGCGAPRFCSSLGSAVRRPGFKGAARHWLRG